MRFQLRQAAFVERADDDRGFMPLPVSGAGKKFVPAGFIRSGPPRPEWYERISGIYAQSDFCPLPREHSPVEICRRKAQPLAITVAVDYPPADVNRLHLKSGILILFVFHRFQIFFHVQRGHATHARGGNGLAIAAIAHVAGHKHAR